MVDDKLRRDEIERAENFEQVKSDVQSDVRNEIAVDAAAKANQQQRIESVADDMRRTAVSEVQQTQHEIERGRVAARISQVVDYLFFILYSVLTIRLLLELFAARESAGFFQFIKDITNPFYAPFRGLVPSPSTPEGFTLALPIIVAIVVYMLLHLAINGLLRIFAHRKVEI